MKQLYYFTGVWCSPCRQLGPIMDEVSQQIPVRKIDVDAEPNMVQQYGIRSVPTVVLVKNEQEVTRLLGLQPKSRYIQLYKQY
jgi:thioredoxin-like negative regulator of GroEL